MCVCIYILFIIVTMGCASTCGGGVCVLLRFNMITRTHMSVGTVILGWSVTNLNTRRPSVNDTMVHAVSAYHLHSHEIFIYECERRYIGASRPFLFAHA